MITIIGAGVAGPLLAYMLHRQGIAVCISRLMLLSIHAIRVACSI
ncbi:hypothetical protein A936_08118 [Enterobacter sp. Ag1]|nr:hypothetical protein A936_08118 [Enterobacter sp. Ag1]